jgi:hypothetical protein
LQFTNKLKVFEVHRRSVLSEDKKINDYAPQMSAMSPPCNSSPSLKAS